MTTFLPRLDIEQLEESTLFFLAASPATDGPLLDLIAKYYLTSDALIEKLLHHPHLAETTLNYIRLFGPPGILPISEHLDSSRTAPIPEAEIQQKRVMTIGQLRTPEKIQLALKGNREARLLLIKDTDRTVASAVLQSPKLTEEEVEKIAQSRNVSEDVLRIVSRNTAWTKSYSIRDALASNPKTPLAISLVFLKGLRASDLNRLSKDKGIPSALRSTAVKMVAIKNLRKA